MDVPPGFYTLTTGNRITADEAARLVFPEGTPWTLLESQAWGPVRHVLVSDRSTRGGGVNVGLAITEAMREQRRFDMWQLFWHHDPRRVKADPLRLSPDQTESLRRALR